MKIVCGKCSADVELPEHGDRLECPSCGAVFRVPSLDEGEELPHPDTFPGYRIKAIIGHGGMGTVYRAIQLSMDREVAIKVLLRKYSDVPRFVNRFDREAQALATLNHPNIVAVIDRGHVQGLYFLVMEYVRGRTLRYYIKHSLLSVERCVEIAIQVCKALEAAHDDGIVHRDIKPGNILVQDDGPVKVADFGIVHMVEEQTNTEQERRSRLGTAKYMAPEQRGTGEVIDPRADIYALGMTLHEMLTGSLPAGEPPSAHSKLVPPALDSIVEQAIEEDRDRRFQSAAAMREALEVLLTTMQLEKTPATITIAASALPTVTCPVCQGQAPAGDDVCPHCQAALREPCYRAECDGVNPIAAERCARCGGHLELLKRQRRAELDALLAQAGQQAAAGRIAEALRLYDEVAADPHGDFAALQERAFEAMAALRHQRTMGILRWAAIAAAAFLIVFLAGVGAYLGVTRLLGDRQGEPQVEQPIPPEEPEPPTSVDPRLATQAPPPTPRRPVFRDYLLALTDAGWPQQAVGARVSAACDASSHLAPGPPDGEAEQRLAKLLDGIEAGQPPGLSRAAVDERLAAGLDALCRAVAATLRGDARLGPKAQLRLQAYIKARQTAREPGTRIDLASRTLDDMLARAEQAQNPSLDLESRLIFLDASLERATGGRPTLPARLRRAARLLVRHLRRQDGEVAMPELLEDAVRRIALAERAPDAVDQMAYSLEALVEALASMGRAG